MSRSFNVDAEKDAPFKRTTIFGIVHANVVQASKLTEGSLEEEQIVKLVDRLKEREIIKSKSEPAGIVKGYIREAQKADCLSATE